MPETDYSQTQSRRNREARAQHNDWIASLSPEEFEQVKALGLDKFENDDFRVHSNRGDKDAADMPGASQGPENDRGATMSHKEVASDLEATWDALRRIIGELLASQNCRLSVECLALASGIAYLGDPEAEIARRHGISRSAVSKRCVELTEKIGLPPSRAMRPLTAKAKYAAARLKNLKKSI